MKVRFVSVLVMSLSLGCASQDDDPVVIDDGVDPRLAEELSVGDTNEPGTGKDDDFRHNGEEDFSEICKPIPDLDPLNDPELVLSLDGRTLHLRDRDGDYDEVFPVGIGKIGSDGLSLTPDSGDGWFTARADARALEDGATSDRRKWSWNYSCRFWSGTQYYNPSSNQQEYRSYFAGLPFIRLEGTSRAVYGLHGPIDNYWREEGGELYRGYVSGGCTRMDPDDLVEVFARINGHATPIKIQQAIEFDADGLSIDSDRFMGAHCLQDSDCADEGAVCAEDPGSDYGFCTKPCEQNSDCPIRENDIIGSIGVLSFCVDDDNDVVDSTGYCAIEGNAKTNNNCRSYPANFRKQRLSLVDDPERTVSVCAL